MENIQLTALLPEQMKTAQSQLIDWCANKCAYLQAEVKELEDAVFHASTMKWATKPIKHQASKVRKRITFFEKVKAALEAGYVIVPNFPVQMFSIRTDKQSPLKMFSSSKWGSKEQSAKELPQGEGEYQNPFPVVTIDSWKDDKGNYHHQSYAEDWAEMEFPITMIKPEIIEATNKAMALNLFDQFGIMPATRNEDPVIIAQIINGRKRVSFMIAWHLNTNVL